MKDQNDEIKDLKLEEQGASNSRPGLSLATGGFFILLGLIYLVQQIAGLDWGRMWVLFLLIPVYWVLYDAWCKYKAAGQTVTPAVVQRLLWGLFPFVMVGANALFNISWGVMWPFMLILIGVSALVNQRS